MASNLFEKTIGKEKRVGRAWEIGGRKQILHQRVFSGGGVGGGWGKKGGGFKGKQGNFKKSALHKKRGKQKQGLATSPTRRCLRKKGLGGCGTAGHGLKKRK